MDPVIVNRVTGWRLVVSFTLRFLNPRGKSLDITQSSVSSNSSVVTKPTEFSRLPETEVNKF
jgi:hypothetical protein